LRTTSLLSGGFRNTNYLLTLSDGERVVLRVSRDEGRMRAECDLIRYLTESFGDIPVPEVLSPFVVSPAACKEICEQLAVVATSIHHVQFQKNGFIGAGLAVVEPFSSYRSGVLDFLTTCLENQLLKIRFGHHRLQKKWRIVSTDATTFVYRWQQNNCVTVILIRKYSGQNNTG